MIHKKDRMFNSLIDAFFYVVLLAGSTVSNIAYELLRPTGRIHQILFIASLVLLHEYYQLFRDNRRIGKRLAFEGFVAICSMILLLLFSLFFVLHPDVLDRFIPSNDTPAYYGSLLCLVPVILISIIELLVALKASYHSHIYGKQSKRYHSIREGKYPLIVSDAARTI